MGMRSWTLSFPPVALATVLFAVTPAQAAVIFSDFGAGHTYNPTTGWTVGGATSIPGFIESAMDFTSATAFTLTQIDVALGLVTGFNGVTLYLEGTTAGHPSDVPLLTWNLTGLPTFGSTGSAIETVTASFDLAAGRYWIVAAATPGHTDTWAAWNLNSIGETGNVAQNTGSAWNVFAVQTQGAFDVQGVIVPEPATALLAAAGLGLLAVLRWKRG